MPRLDGGTYYQTWQASDPRAVVLLLHGHGEHTGHYHRFAAALNHAGITVWGADARGHGVTGGEPGIVGDVEDLADDADAVAALARAATPDVPFSLVGHSMGGVTAGVLALRRPGEHASVTLTGTPLRPFPEFEREPLMSRDPFYLDALAHDPYRFDNADADGALRASLEPAMARISAGLPGLDLPLLCVNGTADEIAPPDVTTALLPDAEHVVVDGAGHDILNDSVHAEVAATVAAFVLRAPVRRVTAH